MNLSESNYKIVENSLNMHGFYFRKKTFGMKLYSSDSGDYMRYYCPAYEKKRSGYCIKGNIGISLSGEDVERFLNSIRSNKKVLNFDILIDNISELMTIPIFKEFHQNDVGIWISKICQSVSKFPVNIQKLAEDISQGYIGKHELWGFLALNEDSDKIIDWILSKHL